MPFSTQNCTEDDVKQALKAHNERLGQILLDTRPLIRDLESRITTIENDILGPLDNHINSLLASSGLTSEDLSRIGGFPLGETQKDLEKASTALGLSIVNGRMLVTNKGDLDISSVKELHRLVGSMESIKKLVPELGTCALSEDMTAGTGFKSRFITIVTSQKVDLVPGVGCKADTQKITEVVTGIDIPIDQILNTRSDLVRQDLIIYVFWFGPAEARQDLKTRALSYGLTEDEYFDALLNKSSENFQVKTIANPYKQICLLSSFLGDDVDEVLTRGFQDNKKPKIKLYPLPEDIFQEIKASGLLTAQPGRINPQGFKDYSCPAILLLATIDPEKTFGSENNGDSPCSSTSGDLSLYTEDLLAGMNAISNVLNSLINEAVRQASKFINKLTDKISKLDALYLKLLSCLIPLGGLPFSVTSPAFSSFIDLLIGGVELFEGVFDGFSQILNVLALLSCIKLSFAEILNSQIASKFPGIACLLNGIQTDICINFSLNIGGFEAGLASIAIAAALTNVSNLLATITALTIGLPSAFADSNCLTPEAVILVAKLAVRGIVLGAAVPLANIGGPDIRSKIPF